MTDFRLLAAKYLRKERGFKYVSLLGKGSYGTVIQMHNDEQGMVAVKLVSKKLANSMEIDHWKDLDHDNILRLLFVDQSLTTCVIFVTALMSKNLTKHLQDKEYREDPNVIQKNKRYLKEVLTGLEYLHGRHLCHLDLRADNIFLGFDGRAVIADFSGLCQTNEKKNFCPLPRCFRPPEMLKTKRKVWPRPIDLWSFGLLTAHLFFLKKFYRITLLRGKIGSLEAIKNYVEAFRDPDTVMANVEKNFPSCRVPHNFCNELTNFISQFLQTKPKKRCSANEALYHSFFMATIHDQSYSTTDGGPLSIPSCSSTRPNDSESVIKRTLDVSMSTEFSSESSRDTQRLLSAKTVDVIQDESVSNPSTKGWKSSEAFLTGTNNDKALDDNSLVSFHASLKDKSNLINCGKVIDEITAAVETPDYSSVTSGISECSYEYSTLTSSHQEDIENETSPSTSRGRISNRESTEFLVNEEECLVKDDERSSSSSKEMTSPSFPKSRWVTFKNGFCRIKDIFRKR